VGRIESQRTPRPRRKSGHPVPRPFLKWVGGKRQLLEELTRHAPSELGDYHEPFVGGGALFFELYRSGRLGERRAFLSDVNKELISAYSAVKRHVAKIVRLLNEHRYEKDHYYRVRALDPWSLSVAERAARTIFLNRTGFNGLYRVNSKGGFNVPFGRYKDPLICDERNLRAVSRALKSVALSCEPFDRVVDRASKGDFVYFDPPYVPLSETANFVNYAQNGFGLADQERLAEVFRKLAENRVFVMLSNSDTPWVREHYRGFPFVEVKAIRNVNSRSDKRGPVGELIVMSYPPGDGT